MTYSVARTRPYRLVLATNAIAVLVYMAVVRLRLDGCDVGDSAATAVSAALIVDIVLGLGLIAGAPRISGLTRRQVALAVAVSLPLVIALVWIGFADANAAGSGCPA